jgi:hypothetical protein
MENVHVEVANNVASSAGGEAFLFKPAAGYDLWRVALINCWWGTGLETSLYTGGGCMFDMASGSGTTDGALILGCYAVGWPGPGLQVNVGSGTVQNFEVNGGSFECNGQQGSLAGTSASSGILINGVPLSMRIHDTECSNNATQGYASTQSYGIYVNGVITGTSTVMINDNLLTGNLTAGLGVSGATYGLSAIDNRGYNNLATLVTSSAPASGSRVDATNIGATPYYGPILVTWSGATITHVRLGAHGFSQTDMGVQTGPFYLKPFNTLEFDYTGSFTTFNVFGQ